MRVDKEQISGVRFMFTIVLYLESSALLTGFLIPVTRHESWLTVLSGLIVSIPVIALFRAIMLMFPDMNLIQVLERVFGPVLGKVLGLSYIWWFLNLTSLNLRDLGDLTKIVILKDTPALVLMVLCIIVTSYAVRYGIKVVTWYSALFMTLGFAILAISVLLVMNQIRFENFLPVFSLPIKKYLHSTHMISTIPLGELMVIMMMTPNVRMSRKDATKYIFGGYFLGGATLLITIIRDIGVLGPTMGLFALPSLMTLRLVRLGEALSRMEILFAIALISQLAFKVMFLHYISVITIAQMFNVRDYKRISLVTGALVIAYGLTLYDNIVDHAVSAQVFAPVFWVIFEMLIPLIVFVTAKLRKLPEIRGT
ncbi:MAG: endospore germination permease [Clostridiales bacterium]|nr:endospore germination permease [Clostridiales bacterium]